ncbi:MAG: alpha/beta hydrolase [Promethearchaeota archaeon]
MKLSIPYHPASSNKEWHLEGECLISNNPAPCSDLAIICHPHPQFGGTMNNNVVTALFHGLKQHASTIRFNFSGVGNSTGIHEGGAGEVKQVETVIEYMTGQFLMEQDIVREWRGIHVIGYSFGAAVAAPAAIKSRMTTSFTSISLPFAMFPGLATKAIEYQKTTHLPIYFLTGDKDDFTDTDTFNQWITKFAGPIQRDTLPNIDHFYANHETTVLEKVKGFLSAIQQNFNL